MKEKKTTTVAEDQDSHTLFPVKEQGPADIVAASCSCIYLLLMLAFFFWLLLDIWSGRYWFLTKLGYQRQPLDAPTFHLMAYATIAGALGCIVNGIRSILYWEGDVSGFSGRFALKYLACPFTGMTLALFVYAIIRGGITIFGADFTAQASGVSRSFSALGVGALAGFGSYRVFQWLTEQVDKLFQIASKPKRSGGEDGVQEGSTSNEPTEEKGKGTKALPDGGTREAKEAHEEPSSDSPNASLQTVDVSGPRKKGG